MSDIANSELHYIKELRSLCQREYTSIEFDTHYMDHVGPANSSVAQILERTTRFVCKTHTTRVMNVTQNTQTNAYKKIRQPVGIFGIDDIELYLHEMEEVMAARKLSLPPFTRDRILSTWKQLLRCYNETKTHDRLNEYIVTLGIGVSTITNDDWKLFLTAKTRSVGVEDVEARWTMLEYNEYFFS